MNSGTSSAAVTGMIFDVQRAAMHDGPGIRTTVFLKGCPLRCTWCHNPEAWSSLQQEADASSPGGSPVTIGRTMSVEEVMEIVRKDFSYYRQSGGGITLSGGEPTVQLPFCKAILRAARSEGIHTCLDTCGFNKPEVFLELLPLVDLFLWDFKATGEPLHSQLTGVPAGIIQRNFELLYEQGASLLVRAPMIPGVNDSNEHLQTIRDLAKNYPGLAGIVVLPYHNAGLSKFDRLHLPRPALETHVPNPADLARWRSKLPAQVTIAE